MFQRKTMKRISRLLRIFFAGSAILFVIGVTFLEIGSRYYKCPDTGPNTPHAWVCNPSDYPVDQKKIQAMQVLIELKRQGIEPSRTNLDQVTNLAEYGDMPGLNGCVCGDGMMFVRDNLGEEGRYYVARHEFEHLLIHNGVTTKCRDEEQCATLNAAKIHPFGFVETILSSIYIAARESPTVWCFLFGSWRIFHTNILGW